MLIALPGPALLLPLLLSSLLARIVFLGFQRRPGKPNFMLPSQLLPICKDDLARGSRSCALCVVAQVSWGLWEERVWFCLGFSTIRCRWDLQNFIWAPV